MALNGRHHGPEHGSNFRDFLPIAAVQFQQGQAALRRDGHGQDDARKGAFRVVVRLALPHIQGQENIPCHLGRGPVHGGTQEGIQIAVIGKGRSKQQQKRRRKGPGGIVLEAGQVPEQGLQPFPAADVRLPENILPQGGKGGVALAEHRQIVHALGPEPFFQPGLTEAIGLGSQNDHGFQQYIGGLHIFHKEYLLLSGRFLE